MITNLECVCGGGGIFFLKESMVFRFRQIAADITCRYMCIKQLLGGGGVIRYIAARGINDNNV